MADDIKLAGKIRNQLLEFTALKIEEKKMFRGLTFMVNDKMCISVSGDDLMCRFDPGLLGEVSSKKGFRVMIMRGKEYRGFCYVNPVGFATKRDLTYWINLCLSYK